MFANRRDAGRVLAEAIAARRFPAPVVLAIPRGGVVVGAEVARQLQAPMDIVVPRKLRAPHHAELAIGAVNEAGDLFLAEEWVRRLNVSQAYLDREVEAQREEIARRTGRYRGQRVPVDLTGKTAILVDDGVATGYTTRAALAAARDRGAHTLVLAVPVAPTATLEALQHDADAVICLETPFPFHAVGEFYTDFGEVSDAEVEAIMQGA
ncbi:MAG: phosphoribosyltransferase family protein [Bacillota bacterium]